MRRRRCTSAARAFITACGRDGGGTLGIFTVLDSGLRRGGTVGGCRRLYAGLDGKPTAED